MKYLKYFSLFCLIATIVCQESLRAELEQLELNFLEGDGPVVTLESCMDDPIFKHTSLVVDPPTITKGQPITFKVKGILLSEQCIDRLYLETFNNKQKMPTFNKDLGKKTYPKGPYGYNYENEVPTIIPVGLWEIYVYLKNCSDASISCIKATFTIPE